MKDYQYYLFDWDGCLAKTLEEWLKAYRETYAEYDLYPADEKIIHYFGDWHGPANMGIADVQEYAERLMAKLEPKLRTVELYPHAKEVLQALKSAGKSLALITSSRKSDVTAALEHNGLSEMFAVVLTREDVSSHKPDPEVVHLALEALQGDKGRAVIIGDSKSDLGAALNAGTDSILVYPEAHKAFYDLEKLKALRPTYVISDFRKLLVY